MKDELIFIEVEILFSDCVLNLIFVFMLCDCNFLEILVENVRRIFVWLILKFLVYFLFVIIKVLLMFSINLLLRSL